MSILSGFFKTIKYRMTDQGYKWQSEKTSSQTVVMGDGTDNTDTAEKRFGAIKGLTSSTSVTDTGYALDATIGKKHEDSIAALNQSLDVKNITSGVKNLTDESTGIDYILKISGNIAFFSCTVHNFRKANSGWANIIQLPSELIPSTIKQAPLGMCSDGQIIRVSGVGIQMYGTHTNKEDVAFTVNWFIK